MKLTENKTKRIEIRVTDEQFKYLKIAGFAVGMNPSQLVRMFIDSTVNSLKLKEKTGELRIEDFKAILDD